MMQRIPEQGRSACGTETPARLLGRPVPTHVLLSGNAQGGTRQLDERAMVSGLLAACRAMAGDRLWEIDGDGDLNGPAKA